MPAVSDTMRVEFVVIDDAGGKSAARRLAAMVCEHIRAQHDGREVDISVCDKASEDDDVIAIPALMYSQVRNASDDDIAALKAADSRHCIILNVDFDFPFRAALQKRVSDMLGNVKLLEAPPDESDDASAARMRECVESVAAVIVDDGKPVEKPSVSALAAALALAEGRQKGNDGAAPAIPRGMATPLQALQMQTPRAKKKTPAHSQPAKVAATPTPPAEKPSLLQRARESQAVKDAAAEKPSGLQHAKESQPAKAPAPAEKPAVSQHPQKSPESPAPQKSELPPRSATPQQSATPPRSATPQRFTAPKRSEEAGEHFAHALPLIDVAVYAEMIGYPLPDAYARFVRDAPPDAAAPSPWEQDIKTAYDAVARLLLQRPDSKDDKHRVAINRIAIVCYFALCDASRKAGDASGAGAFLKSAHDLLAQAGQDAVLQPLQILHNTIALEQQCESDAPAAYAEIQKKLLLSAGKPPAYRAALMKLRLNALTKMIDTYTDDRRRCEREFDDIVKNISDDDLLAIGAEAMARVRRLKHNIRGMI